MEDEESLAALCEEQKRVIEKLQEELKAKETELQQFRRDSKREKEMQSPIKPPARTAQPVVAKPNAGGAEFWDSHLESHEGSEYSFEDIAAKGLWILTSGSERKTDPSPLPVKKHPAYFPKPGPPKDSGLPSKNPLFTSPQRATNKASYGGDFPFPKAQERSPKRPSVPPVPSKSPQKPQLSPQRPVNLSPFKSKSLQQALEAVRTSNADFPPSQGYLRMGLKPSVEKSREMQQNIHRPAKPKKPTSESPGKGGKILSPVPVGKKPQVPGHRKAISLAQPR